MWATTSDSHTSDQIDRKHYTCLLTKAHIRLLVFTNLTHFSLKFEPICFWAH
ncbi:hypothetical protein RSAG8_10839, partial [Rhizoctonia solani AG-8 WAC10335]